MSLGCSGSADDPLLIGHRGDPFRALENSLESFRLAYEAGADGVELDVQLTADGQVIVMHDDTLDRTTTCQGDVRSYDLAALAGCQLANGEPILLLADLLARIGADFSVVFVEIKVTEIPPEDAVLVALADHVADVVRRSDYADRTVVISYDPVVLRRLGELGGHGISAGWDDQTTDAISKADRHGLSWVLMPSSTAEPWMGQVVHGLGKQFAVYGVNTPTEFERMVRAEVDAMMADSVKLLCTMAGRKPRDAPGWEGG